MNQVQHRYLSEIGPIYIVCSPKSLHGLHWKKQASVPMADLKSESPAVRVIQKTIKQLSEYFAGQRQKFNLPLEPDGTPFQKSVWAELSKIPFGTTCSYADIAKKIGNPKAVRAVGTANGRNPLSLVVPCHRVITSSGTLGGYAGGLKVKERLLQIEGCGEFAR